MSKFTRWLETWHIRNIEGAVTPYEPDITVIPKDMFDELLKEPADPETQIRLGLKYIQREYGVGRTDGKVCEKVPSISLGAMKVDSGTPESPNPDECAHTALSLIYRRERDEARQRLEDVVVEHQKAGKSWDAIGELLIHERDEARRDRDRFAQTIEFRVKELDDARATIERRTNVAVRLEGMLLDAEGTIDLLRTDLDEVQSRIDRLFNSPPRIVGRWS